MAPSLDRTGMIGLAFGVARAVAGWAEHARLFFYDVVLADRTCPDCEGPLGMVAEGRCRCKSCGRVFDPTPAFQTCPGCGGPVELKVSRYRCCECGADVPSRFLFDGLVFDAEYFRQRMDEHRQRKLAQRERVRQMLAGSRSEALLPSSADLDEVPGLAEALNNLVSGIPMVQLPWSKDDFDLRRYEGHLQAHIGAIPLAFEHIPPLAENRRLDRVRRFIAILYLASAGIIDVWQDGQVVMVMKHETDGERQGLLGDAEDADGVEGPVGGATAW